MTREEFDKWIGRYRRRLVKMAIRLCGREAAADAVQDAIIAIYTNRTYRKVKHATNLVAYFFQTVRYCARHQRASVTARVRRERDYTQAEWVRAGAVIEDSPYQGAGGHDEEDR